MNLKNSPQTVSKGVQELIDEIREKGVAEGREQGARIVADAEARAEWIVEQAQEEARRVMQAAESEAAFIREAGKEALHIALRDVLLRLRDELSEHLGHELQSMIGQKLQQQDALSALLKGVAARVAGEAVPEELLIPDSVVGLEALKANPQALSEGMLPQLLTEVLGQLMKKGVTVLASSAVTNGCQLQYQDGMVTIDLNEEVLSTVLMAHLQPRFRAILDGVVAGS